MIVVDGEPVRFTHPLFASAIYSAAVGRGATRAHRRLAALADEHGAARATPGALHGGPGQRGGAHRRRRRGRGSPARCTGGRRRARRAGDSPHSGRTTPMSATGARSSSATTSSRRATRNARGTSCSPSPIARPASRAGRSSTSPGSTTGARAAGRRSHRCEQALTAAAGDQRLEATCHAELAVYCDFDAAALRASCARGARAARARAMTQIRTRSSTRSWRPREPGLVLGRGLPHDLIERAFESESRAATSIHRSRVGAQLGQWLKYVDDFAGLAPSLEAALSQAVQEGDESSMPNELMHLAQLECWSGNWPLASRYADESFELAEQGGQSFGGPPAMRALIDAHLGERRARPCHGRGAARGRGGRGDGRSSLSPRARLPRAVARRRRGRRDRICRARVELAESFGIREPGVFRVHADLIEALIGLGRLDRAGSAARRARRAGRGQPGARGRSPPAARCRGLLLSAHGDLDAAERSLEDALAAHERLPMPFELGRTLLAFGLLERRRERAAPRERAPRAGTRDLRGSRCATLGRAGAARAAAARWTADKPI